MKNISHHISSLTTGATKGLKNLKLLASLATVLTFSSCDKTTVDPINPGTEVPVEKSRLTIARDEFNAQNSSLVAPNSLDHRRSDFEAGYVGKLQYEQILKSMIENGLTELNNQKIVLVVRDNGDSTMFDVLSQSKYKKILETGIFQFRAYGNRGLVSQSSEKDPTRNIYKDPDNFTLNATSAANNHGGIIMKEIIQVNGSELNINHLLTLAEKYPTYNSSPFQILVEGYVKSKNSKVISNESVFDRINREAKSRSGYSVLSTSFSPTTLSANGKPAQTMQNFIDNQKLLSYTSLPNQGEEGSPSFPAYMEAAKYYNKNTKNQMMVANSRSQTNPVLLGNYPEGAVSVVGNRVSTSETTPAEAIKAGWIMLVSGGKINPSNFKDFINNGIIKTPSGIPANDYGVNLLRAMGLIPSLIETGQIDSYLISDKFEVIDPSGKIAIDCRDGKSYIKSTDAQKYAGTTLNLIARIAYGGKIYFPALPVKVGTSSSGVNITTYAVN